MFGMEHGALCVVTKENVMANTPSFTLSGEPTTLAGTWFIAASGLSKTKKHVVATCVPRSGPYQGKPDRLTIMLPADAAVPLPGSEIDDPTVSAQVTGFDEQRNPVFAPPTVREPPADRQLAPGDDGIRVYHGCYLEGASAVRKPGDVTKLARGASILANVSGFTEGYVIERQPLTESDLG
jgi:hypothetical protein